MRILNSLMLPKNVKTDALGFFIIHFIAKFQKNEEVPFETLKNFRKQISQNRKRRKFLNA